MVITSSSLPPPSSSSLLPSLSFVGHGSTMTCSVLVAAQCLPARGGDDHNKPTDTRRLTSPWRPCPWDEIYLFAALQHAHSVAAMVAVWLTHTLLALQVLGLGAGRCPDAQGQVALLGEDREDEGCGPSPMSWRVRVPVAPSRRPMPRPPGLWPWEAHVSHWPFLYLLTAEPGTRQAPRTDSTTYCLTP